MKLRTLGDTIVSLALCGPFIPNPETIGLVPDDLPKLADLCDEVTVGPEYAWSLRADARREALRSLENHEDLRRALRAAPRLARGDDFGRALRAVLRGDQLPSHKIDARGAGFDEAAHSALQFAALVPAADSERIGSELNRVRARMFRRRRADVVGSVLSGRLFGRDDELRSIEAFLDGKGSDTRPLLLTGDGGMGKSALIAGMLERRRNSREIAILLDCDRPALARGAPDALTFEFLRQLTGLAEPLLAPADATAFTRAVRDLRLGYGRAIASETFAEDQSLQLSVLFSRTIPALASVVPAAVRERGITLIIDSFEVMGVHGAIVVDRVLALEAELRRAALPRLRTIVSGRGRPPASAPEAFGPKERHIELGGLPDRDGALLLMERDRGKRFSEPLAQRASYALGGRPLALVVLARLARTKRRDGVPRLVADLESDPQFRTNIAQSFLYTRILDRIRDVDLRRLAHPGLVLREVNARAIVEILAEPCGLGAVDKTRAHALLEKLARLYWLVEQRQDGSVVHRADLRRAILPDLFTGATEGETGAAARRRADLRNRAIEVALRAATRHRAAAREASGADVARRETALGHYYEILSGRARLREFERAEALALLDAIGLDLTVLPAEWRAALKASAGRLDDITDVERRTLSGNLRKVVGKRKLDDARKYRMGAISDISESSAAIVLSATSTLIAGKPVVSTAEFDPEAWEKEFDAAFDICVWPRALRLIELLSASAWQKLADHYVYVIKERPQWDAALWRAMLLLAVHAEGPARISRLVEHFGDSVPRSRLGLLMPLIATTDRLIETEPYSWRQQSPIDGLRVMGISLSRYRDARRSSIPLRSDGLSLAAPWAIGGRHLNNFYKIKSKITRNQIYSTLQSYVEFGPKLQEYIYHQQATSITISILDILYEVAESFNLDGLRNLKSNNEIRSLLEVLRGLTPEIYTSVSVLLAALSINDLVNVAREVIDSTPSWPLDFFREDPSKDLGRLRTMIPTFVRTADRCGSLEILLEALRKETPDAEPLLRMYRLITDRFFTLPEDRRSSHDRS